MHSCAHLFCHRMPPLRVVNHAIYAYYRQTCRHAKEKRKQFANNLFLRSDVFLSGLFSSRTHIFVHSHIGVREYSC